MCVIARRKESDSGSGGTGTRRAAANDMVMADGMADGVGAAGHAPRQTLHVHTEFLWQPLFFAGGRGRTKNSIVKTENWICYVKSVPGNLKSPKSRLFTF